MDRTHIPVVSLLAALLALSGCSGSGPADSPKAETPAAPAYFTVEPSTAGSISGKILYTGRKPSPPRIRMDEEAACARMHPGGMTSEELIVNDDSTLANVFVYVKSGLEGKTFAPAARPVTINQKGCRYEPRVIGIRTGQLFQVLNSDPVSHNIHPIPAVNREWNQSQSPGAAPLEREFARPEVMVPVKCNVHSWMRAYIGVLEHPYYAVTGVTGAFDILNLPPGDYTVEAWHEKLGVREQKITLAASGKAALDFMFKGE